VQLARELDVDAVRYQGNWIPHQLRTATEDGIFFVGDGAGHCLPTTAEGIRTAFYFGIECGRQLRAVVDGRQTRGQALTAYARFSDAHAWKFRWLLRVQHLVGHANGTPVLGASLRLMDNQRFIDWAFHHYLEIAPPEHVLRAGAPSAPRRDHATVNA
jgi:flavin-dependent dehydrogenase